MTSRPGLQSITIQKLPNTSRSKGNHTMKFGRVIEYYWNHAENVAGRLVPDFLLFFKKAFC